MARRRSTALALSLLACLTPTAFMATLIATSAAQEPEQQELQIEVTECGDPNAPNCQTRSEALPRSVPSQRSKQTVPRTSAGPVPTAAAEHHQYSLKTGRGTVTTAEGVAQESVDLASAPVGAGTDPDDAKPGPAPGELPSVTTVGGAGGGSASPFEYVSADEALAQFAVPPFLVPIYVAAGRAYGVPWNVLASINRIETDFGRNVNVSSAGAIGWMQFMPSTWERWGVDATGDGLADPYNPVDAIYGAARYLKASGAASDLRRAVFAYNHADWYVDSVLGTANVYGALPSGLVAETGSLAYGRFPVRGPVSYGDDFRRAQAAGAPANELAIAARPGAVAVATQDVTVKRILVDRRTAHGLRRSAALARTAASTGGPELPSSERVERLQRFAASAAPALGALGPPAFGGASAVFLTALQRAAPRVSGSRARASIKKGARAPVLPRGYGRSRSGGFDVIVRDAAGNEYRYEGLGKLRRGLRPGDHLRGGARLGTLPRQDHRPKLGFAVRATGGAAIDPRPLVDGYRLLEAASFHNALRAVSGNPFVPSTTLVANGVVRGSDRQLADRVLHDAGLHIYGCGREDVERGAIDRRILGSLLYLRRAGLELTITSLHCGHSYYTAGGNVSAHSFGAAVDIAAFNGQPVIGNQGPGSLTEQAIRLLMQLDGETRPTQLISLMNLGGPSFAMSDHDDHLHVGYAFDPTLGLGRTGGALGGVIFGGGHVSAEGDPALGASRGNERRLSDKLGAIRNPHVGAGHSDSSLRVEAERRDEQHDAAALARTQMPLRVQPTTAGAKLLDIAVPAGRSGDDAYAIALVDGRGHRDWATRQTVIMRNRAGAWEPVGAPVDRSGRVANPRLRALGLSRSGDGYAVGDRGAVVLLRRSGPPRLLAPVTRADLLAVATRRAAGRLNAVAVGSKGAVVDLQGTHARSDRVSGAPDLAAVELQRDGPVLAAGGDRSGSSPVLLRRAGGAWRQEGATLDRPNGSALRLAAVVTDRDGRTWVAGGLADTAGGPERPFAARRSASGWTTWCSGPAALAAIRELGPESRRGPCDHAWADESRGPATDLVATARGIVAATQAGAELQREGAFVALPGLSGGVVAPRSGSPARLAITREGEGWALISANRLVQIARARPAPDTSAAPAPLTAIPTPAEDTAALSLAAGTGDSALALAAGRPIDLNGGDASALAVPPTPLQAVALAGETAWAIDVTGALLRLGEKGWAVPGESGLDRLIRQRVGESLADAPAGALPAAPGPRALAFQSADRGYAVGSGGRVLRFDGDDWSQENVPVTDDLAAIAAAGDRAVASGPGGVLLERDAAGWRRLDAVRALAPGADFTAVAAVQDGTLLAAAGGTVLQSRGSGASWTAANLPPLGIPVMKLAALRTPAGDLNALALVEQSGERFVLRGDPSGWRPLDLPAGLHATDFSYAPGSAKAWVSGSSGGRPVAVELPLGA